MKSIAIHDGHNASAAYMKDGVIQFAIQEERLTKIKNSIGFPAQAIAEILRTQKLSAGDIDAFIFTDVETTGGGIPRNRDGRDATLAFYRKMFGSGESFGTKLRKTLHQMTRIAPPIERKLRARAHAERQERRMRPLIELGADRSRILFYDHHTCHASAAAWGGGLKAPFAVITSDGVGDGLCGTVSVFDGTNLERRASIPMEDSIARLYAMATFYLGMVPLEHEYKLMGMAPYASGARDTRKIADELHSLFRLNPDGLTYSRAPGVRPIHLLGPELKKLFAYRRFDHLSAGLQLFVEEFVTEWVRSAIRTLGVRRVALSGGLFMNVKLNKRIMELEEVEDIFIFPSCGDETNVFGGLYRHSAASGIKPRPLEHFYLGGEFSDADIEKVLRSHAFKTPAAYEKISDMEAKIAELLAKEEVVARMGGRMEFGARALGNRSILANAAHWDSVKVINAMIKSRDFWMPFAPSSTRPADYIRNPKNIRAPYMIMTFDSNPEKTGVMRAAIHPYDETCRLQEVDARANPSYFKIIEEFGRLTGEHIILNTSFNLHGFPVVYTPQDALHVFDNSGLEYLALGNYLVKKVPASAKIPS